MFTLVCSERGNEITANSADVGERDPDHDDHQQDTLESIRDYFGTLRRLDDNAEAWLLNATP